MPGSSSIQLAGGTVPASPPTAESVASCAVSVDVLGTNTNPGAVTITNSIAGGTWGGVQYEGGSTTLIINPLGIYGTKDISTTVNFYYGKGIYAGDLVPVTITLYNSTTTTANITSFTDDLTSMGGIGMVHGLALPPSQAQHAVALSMRPSARPSSQ